MKKVLLGLVALVMWSMPVAAADLVLSTGSSFLPGFRMVDGSDLNVMVNAINTLNGGGSFTGALLPSANNTYALGSATLEWSDAFLGSGAVVNFNNGDVTITHGSHSLAIAGATSGFSQAGPVIISEASNSALLVGPTGVSNPTLQVDAGTASAATGLKIKSAAAAGGLALSVISSGAAENLTMDAKGTGTVTIAGTSTGNIVLGHAATGVSFSGTGAVTAFSGTAIPAGGTADTGYLLSSTAHFGVFFGSGAPSLSAAQGSLYLRSDGSGVSDRAYINTDGGTTWTSLTTAG